MWAEFMSRSHVLTFLLPGAGFLRVVLNVAYFYLFSEVYLKKSNLLINLIELIDLVEFKSIF